MSVEIASSSRAPPAYAQQVQQVTVKKGSLDRLVRHCEEQSDEAIQFWVTPWIASP
jgi:hypothetical protein